MKDLQEKREKLIKNHKKKLAKLDKEIEAQKPVDGWYTIILTKALMYLKDGKFLFGIDYKGEKWLDKEELESEYIWYNELDWSKATDGFKDYQLDRFVNNLGYKEGVEVICNFENDCNTLTSRLSFACYENIKDYDIWFGNISIWNFKKGWAKIVEPKQKYTVKSYCDYFTVVVNGKAISGDETAKRLETLLNQEK